MELFNLNLFIESPSLLFHSNVVTVQSTARWLVPSVYLFSVQQAGCVWEAEHVCLELWVLTLVVQLETGAGHLGLQHLPPPVVDADL